MRGLRHENDYSLDIENSAQAASSLHNHGVIILDSRSSVDRVLCSFLIFFYSNGCIITPVMRKKISKQRLERPLKACGAAWVAKSNEAGSCSVFSRAVVHKREKYDIISLL